MHRDRTDHERWQPRNLLLAIGLSCGLWVAMFSLLPLSLMLTLIGLSIATCAAIVSQPIVKRWCQVPVAALPRRSPVLRPRRPSN